jgi:MFS family permease
VLVLWVSPFDRLLGDMLATIDRSLDELLAGRFPYVNFPPPMPYLPGTFLAFEPPKLLGWDIRVTNLVLDVVAVAAVTLDVGAAHRRRLGVSHTGSTVAPSLGQLALPFFMLDPAWTYYSVNTQVSPSLLASVLLGRAVASAGPQVQALALGLAVGSNQMLGVCSPILFGHWLGRYGPRRALGLAILSIAVFMALIAPFLLWYPKRFLHIAFLSRGALPPEVMSRQFTLLPLVSGIVPHASVSLSSLAVLIGATFAMRAHRPEAVVAAMALGLCGALLLQPVSFPHYFLPVIALVAAAPMPGGSLRGGPHKGRMLRERLGAGVGRSRSSPTTMRATPPAPS